MSDRLCASGHVVEVGRDTCSRCNGVVIEEKVDILSEQENTTMQDENQEAAAAPAEETAAEAPAEEATEQAAPVAEDKSDEAAAAE